jgi:hypothetical protein
MVKALEACGLISTREFGAVLFGSDLAARLVVERTVECLFVRSGLPTAVRLHLALADDIFEAHVGSDRL